MQQLEMLGNKFIVLDAKESSKVFCLDKAEPQASENNPDWEYRKYAFLGVVFTVQESLGFFEEHQHGNVNEITLQETEFEAPGETEGSVITRKGLSMVSFSTFTQAKGLAKNIGELMQIEQSYTVKATGEAVEAA